MNTKKSPVLKRLLAYALQYKTRIGVAIVILIASVGAQLAGPIIAKNIIDKHILAIEFAWYEAEKSELPAGVRFVEFDGSVYVRSDWIAPEQIPGDWGKARIYQNGSSFYIESEQKGRMELTEEDVLEFYRHDVTPVFMMVGMIVGLALTASLLSFIQGYMLQTTALRIVQKMRMDVMKQLHRLPVRYFDNTPVGQIVSRVANDTEAIKELFMSFMATFAVSGMHLAGVFVALFILDARLALLCLVLLPLYAGIMAIHLKFSQKYVTVIRNRLADMNAMLNESIAVMPIIQAFRREKATIREFESLNDERYRNQVMQFRIFALSGRNIVYFIGRLVTAMVIWYFGSESLSSTISFGVFYAFIDYLGRIYEPIIGIFDQLMNAQRAFVSAERVFNLLDEEGTDVQPVQRLPRPEGHVVFDRVSFAYKEGEYVLNNISFEAKPGETVALVGHTGSGKSSIMNLLLGFYEPNKGEIRINGKPIASFSKQDLRKHMGIVLQEPFLFTGDIKFNVSLYEESIDIEKVKSALRAVGAEPFVKQLPSGYDEPVVERGATLSAGQRQLISFARALAYNPAILILDEATSSIDSETEGIIQNALKVLCEGRTTFVIAHRLSTIRDADQILVLHRGEIVERGNHHELMKLQGRYYKMYQLQHAEVGSSTA